MFPCLEQALGSVFIGAHLPGIETAVVVRPHPKAQGQLLQIADARDSLAPTFGFRERRQQQPGENGDDRDDNEQFDESKATATTKCFFARTSSFDYSRFAHGRPRNETASALLKSGDSSVEQAREGLATVIGQRKSSCGTARFSSVI